jgi:hypothetical protein
LHLADWNFPAQPCGFLFATLRAKDHERSEYSCRFHCDTEFSLHLADWNSPAQPCGFLFATLRAKDRERSEYSCRVHCDTDSYHDFLGFELDFSINSSFLSTTKKLTF